MNIRFFLASIALTVASSAGAQVQRAFVASTGSDANPCSRTQPCRNFAAAVAAVVDGGEVVVLDSAGYGTVTIGKSVSLIAPPGVYAGIAAPGANGILIIAPAATVIIRGITINGDINTVGVWAQGIGTLHIDDCLFTHDGNGVILDAGGALFVNNSSFRENNLALEVDLFGSDIAVGAIDHCRFENNMGTGMAVSGSTPGSKFTIRDSLFVENAYGLTAALSEVHVENCSFAKNGNAIDASNNVNTYVAVSGCMLVDNQVGFLNEGSATLKSFGDNALTGNVSATSGFITTGTKQ